MYPSGLWGWFLACLETCLRWNILRSRCLHLWNSHSRLFRFCPCPPCICISLMIAGFLVYECQPKASFTLFLRARVTSQLPTKLLFNAQVGYHFLLKYLRSFLSVPALLTSHWVSCLLYRCALILPNFLTSLLLRELVNFPHLLEGKGVVLIWTN